MCKFLETVNPDSKLVSDISRDSQVSREVLGNLEIIWNDDEHRSDLLQSTPVLSLTKIIEDCLSVSETLVDRLGKQAASTSEKRPEEFMENELRALHNDLINHKIALRVSICLANRYALILHSYHND